MSIIQEECKKRFAAQIEYLGDNKPVNKTIPLVSVNVTTYQHAHFIARCLDGILMQETGFPFEILVGEDESTDGTREICIAYAEKHPDKIRLFLRDRKESQFYDDKGTFLTRFNGRWLRLADRGKYIAICEGDDYWTDPEKLQRQVDFLESHPDYVAVAENGIIRHTENQTEVLFNEATEEHDVTVGELIRKRRFPTASVMLRASVIQNYEKEVEKSWDTMLWCYLAAHGKFRYQTNISSVYNRGAHGMVESTETLAWASLVEKWNLQLIKHFGGTYFDPGIAIDHIWSHYWKAYVKLFGQRKYFRAASAARKCYQYRPGTTILQQTRHLFKAVWNGITLITGEPLKMMVTKIKSPKESRPAFFRYTSAKGVDQNSGRKIPLILSLTSYPGRMNTLHFTLHTLLNQSLKPDRVILWLAEEQFPDGKRSLPRKVLKLRKYGLEIRWWHDIKSYKKLIPTLSTFPDALIVTADDDFYYPPTWLESLYTAYLDQPEFIHCQRAHRIRTDPGGEISPYSEWEKITSNQHASFLTFPTSGGGVIYPPGCFHPDVLNEKLFISLAPTTDDIWFWACTTLKGKKNKLVRNFTGQLPFIDGSQESGLWRTTNIMGQNDISLRNVLLHFPALNKQINHLSDDTGTMPA